MAVVYRQLAGYLSGLRSGDTASAFFMLLLNRLDPLLALSEFHLLLVRDLGTVVFGRLYHVVSKWLKVFFTFPCFEMLAACAGLRP